MNAGKLDRKIRIESRVETQNDYGEAVISYVLLANVWAEVIPLSGREFFTAAQFVPEARLKIKIRYRSDIDERCRIIFESVPYDILHIAEIGRREGLEIMVKKP
jgi:SPP1 family predicted phage head-tail adaptor